VAVLRGVDGGGGVGAGPRRMGRGGLEDAAMAIAFYEL
jgi:hypothetical protein